MVSHLFFLLEKKETKHQSSGLKLSGTAQEAALSGDPLLRYSPLIYGDEEDEKTNLPENHCLMSLLKNYRRQLPVMGPRHLMLSHF